MITPKDIELKTMTEEKRKFAKNDLFAFYIGRPCSYVLTIPFLYTNISPNFVSLLSMIPTIIGFLIMTISSSKNMYIIACACFFLWNLLDGVDGNIARYNKQFSKMGSVYDAMSGYLTMMLSFFAIGIAAYHSENLFDSTLRIPKYFYIVLGGLSGMFEIFPRLVMHKALNTVKNNDSTNSIKDRSSYGILKVIALNLTSIAGFVQIFMLVAVIFDLLDIFTIIYFIINLFVMIASLYKILKVE